MKHTHHLPSPEFLFLPIHLSFSTGKWPHPFCHFLTPFKQLPFCFLILQHRSSHETLSGLSVWHEILQFYHFLHADWPGKSKQELCSIFISKANLQEDLYGVFSVSDAVCPGHRTSLEEDTCLWTQRWSTCVLHTSEHLCFLGMGRPDNFPVPQKTIYRLLPPNGFELLPCRLETTADKYHHKAHLSPICTPLYPIHSRQNHPSMKKVSFQLL